MEKYLSQQKAKEIITDNRLLKRKRLKHNL